MNRHWNEAERATLVELPVLVDVLTLVHAEHHDGGGVATAEVHAGDAEDALLPRHDRGGHLLGSNRDDMSVAVELLVDSVDEDSLPRKRAARR